MPAHDEKPIRLRKAARIKRFVPLLAEKHTKEILRMAAGPRAGLALRCAA